MFVPSRSYQTSEAIRILTDGAWDGYVSGNDDVLEINWGSINPIDQSIVDQKVAELESAWTNTQYQRDRVYPPIGDQLDALFHAGVFPEEMAAQIQAVKDAHPKPE